MSDFPLERRSPEQVRRALEEAIHRSGEDYAAISRLLKKNNSYIHQFIFRGTPRELREVDREILSAHLNVPEYELGGPPDRASQTTSSDAEPEKYLFIKSYDISASAGPGVLVGAEDAKGELAFRRDWIKQVSNAPPEQLAVMRVEGDSMYPTLAHGDQVLIDRQQNEVLRDGIYVLRVDDHLQIKRILVHPGTRQIRIKSDNPLFDHWNECEPDSLHVLGRAVWVGRRL